MANHIKTDVLIIGTGPVGACFARVLAEAGRKVLMVDGGNQLSPRPGEHLKNAYIYQRDRNHFTPVVTGELFPLSVPTQDADIPNLDPDAFWAPQGVRNNMNPDQKPNLNMPSGQAAYAVGGMGVHWTCATPRLNPKLERWSFISDAEWGALYGSAEQFFGTHTNVFSKSLRGKVIQKALKEFYGNKLSPEYPVQELPVAARRRTDNTDLIHWTGPYDILQPALDTGRVEVQGKVLVRKLHHRSGRVTHVEAVSLDPWEKHVEIHADEFYVAAGAILTPQLLWNSGIFRGDKSPLGHYLNDQPLAFTQVVLTKEIVKQIRGQESYIASMEHNNPRDPVPIPQNDPDPTLWIPVQEGRPWHCQVHKDAFNYGQVPDNIDDRLVVDLRWFTMTQPVFENHVSFSEQIHDIRGLPQPTFHYTVPGTDSRVAHEMMADMMAAASVFGGILPSSPPQFMPPGASLHYMGTYRMGEKDDGTCVCDPYSKVWGFENLRLGGPGIFPTATAANPTLTAGAMAIRAAKKLV